jgi:hypothetical protein
MRHLIKKCIYIAVILLIIGLLFQGYVYTARTLKSFVVKTLENNFGTRLSIGHMRLRFPLCLELKNVKINNAIDIGKIYIYGSPASFLVRDSFIFSGIKIVDPVITIKKENNYAFTDFVILNNKPPISAKDSGRFFYLSSVNIENGTAIYDFKDGVKLEFVKIRGRIKNPDLYFAGSHPLAFKLAGLVKNQDPRILSPLKINGWITKDNAIKAKLHIKDIALDTLGPVYMNYLKDKVSKGKLCFDSRIQVSKNNLRADCFCRINDVLLKGASTNSAVPLLLSFIFGFDFEDKVVKITNLQSNLVSFIFNKT